MEKSYILTIDQGTTNTKGFLINKNGVIEAKALYKLKVKYPKPAWVEQDPIELWFSVKKVIDDCFLKLDNPKVDAIAITNQRESVILWDRKTGEPVGPCIVWQCRRTENLCKKLKEKKLGSFIRKRTGLPIDPIFSASKVNWLIKHTKNGSIRAKRGELCFGTVDSWILFKLTGGKTHLCDISNASRTQLFNINDLKWDEEMLKLFEIPRAVLPKVKQSSEIFGISVKVGQLLGGIPIASMIGDSHAALFGHTCFKPGGVKVTYGTGSSLMTPINSPVNSNLGLSTTIAWMLKGKPIYALEGVIHISGAVVQWICKILNIDNQDSIESLARSVKDTGGVYFVPAFVGLGAPHWDETARGLISGLTNGSERNHLVRAALESIAYQVLDIFDVMRIESGYKLDVLLADGAPSSNNFLMQFQADIIGCPIYRRREVNISALGAAYLAGLAIGWWSSEKEIKNLEKEIDSFKPRITNNVRDKLYKGWKKAVKRSILYSGQ